jgi:hypothetical protein
MQSFFTYIGRTNLSELISFTDYYSKNTIPEHKARVNIVDPVNAGNNVSRLYTTSQADAIVDAALEAGDAIDSALAAPTKEETVHYWQKVLGPTFHA